MLLIYIGVYENEAEVNVVEIEKELGIECSFTTIDCESDVAFAQNMINNFLK